MNPSAFDANTIMANVSANQAQPTDPTQVQPKPSGNWFTHLLPTIGGIGGGILGGLATAGLGGEVAGGAGGAALGKSIENALEGKAVLQGNDVTAGIEGGAGNLAGGILGKALGKGASMLAGRAENIGAQQAAKTAAEDSIEKSANTYKDINPKLQGNLGAKDALDHVTNVGYDIGDPANLVHVSNTSNDILNETLNRALANSGPVDLSHYPQIIKDALAKEAGTLGSYEKVALSRGRLGYANTPSAKLLQQLEDLGAGTAKTTSDPNELRTLTTKLGNLAADAKPMPTAATGAVDPVQRSSYNVINNVRDQVKNALYNRPEVSNAIKGEVGNLVPNAEMNITPELANHLNDVITKSGDAQGLLDEISRNINIGKLGQEGQKVGQIVTSTGAQARAAADAGLSNEGTDVHPLLQMGGIMAAAPHAGVMATAAKGVAHAANNPKVLDVLSRIGGLGAKLAPAAGTVAATAPNLAADPLANAAAGGTMGGNMTPTVMQHQGNDTGNYLDAIRTLSILDPSHYGSMGDSVLGLTPMIQKNQMLNGEINAMPAGYANAGGAQGLGGILSHISGLIPGTAAHSYEAQRQAAAQQLAASMGISPAAAAGLLPQLMQNDQTSGISSGILGNLQGQLAY